MSEPAYAVVIAGGGTGGHLYPGLALADALKARGVAVTFIGTERGLEAKAVPQAGYPLELIKVSGLKSQGLLGTLRSLLRLPGAFLHALRLLRRLRPQVVVGVGGYASGPVALLSALTGTKVVILEQNSIPGFTNRVLGRFASSVIIALPQAATYFPSEKVQQLGNPIRGAVKAAASPPAASAEQPLRVLVLGGSQGARAVNDLVSTALVEWQQAPPAGTPPLAATIRLRHQTGTADRERIEARYRDAGLGPELVTVDAFITDMGRAYAESDLVVGRAGATTIAELCAVGRPALFIPFPQAADDHQTHNARGLAAVGAAHVLPQASTRPAELIAQLARLHGDRAALLQMAASAQKLGRPDAAERVADHVLALAGVGAAGR